MKHAPTVSIVLPTCNGSRFLAESIRSCLEQTYTNFELILVDDASTDATPGLIAEWTRRDARVRTIRNAVNRRLPGSLNVGFARARGELLTWTSDDNCYRPEALEEMVAFMRQHRSVSMVYADYALIDEDGDEVATVQVEEPEALPLRNCVGACFLMRREVHTRLGGYAKDLFLAEDYDFWLRASAEFRLATLHKDLYQYRYHRSSLTTGRREEIRLATVEALRRNLPRLRWMSPELKSRAEASLAELAAGQQDFGWNWDDASGCRKVVWCALRAGRVRVARKYAMTAIKLAPFSRESWRAAACALRGH